MYQSLCNPPKASLLTAIRQGFLRSAPHLSKKAIAKYLPLSPATSEGHMKRHRKGLRRTTPRAPCINVPARIPDPIIHSLIPLINPSDSYDREPCFHFINDVDDHLIANIFCFGAFANIITGVVYNNCTVKFPFMLLDRNVCFYVMFHYKTNAILATPIPGLNSSSILAAYKNFLNILKKKVTNQR